MVTAVSEILRFTDAINMVPTMFVSKAVVTVCADPLSQMKPIDTSASAVIPNRSFFPFALSSQYDMPCKVANPEERYPILLGVPGACPTISASAKGPAVFLRRGLLLPRPKTRCRISEGRSKALLGLL